MGKLDDVMDLFEIAMVTAEKGVNLSNVQEISGQHIECAVSLDPSWIRERLDRLMVGEYADRGLDVLNDSGILRHILPEIANLVNFSDGESRHKDVWRHTKQVVVQAPARLELRWSSLFHDIGKFKTRTIAEDGSVHFLKHEKVGAKMFAKLDRRTRLFSMYNSITLKSTIHFLVLNHLRAHQYNTSWSDSAVRRFAREIGCHLPNLMDLSKADITTSISEKRHRFLANLEELGTRIEKLAQEDAKVPALPSGIGEAIKQHYNIPSGRKVGEVKTTLEALVASGELDPCKGAGYYINFIKKNPDRFEP